MHYGKAEPVLITLSFVAGEMSPLQLISVMVWKTDLQGATNIIYTHLSAQYIIFFEYYQISTLSVQQHIYYVDKFSEDKRNYFLNIWTKWQAIEPSKAKMTFNML